MRRVSLPNWTDENILPGGAWPTDLQGIHDRFVDDAPNKDEREVLFNALTLYLNWIRPLVGPASIWIDGGFSMRKNAPPNDVDIVIFPDDWECINSLDSEGQKRLWSSITHQDVSSNVASDGLVPRVQPMAGMLDAFISPFENRDYWRGIWSRVKLDGIIIEELTKGFAEVRI